MFPADSNKVCFLTSIIGVMGAGGPAHAVHFGAYELVMEFTGGNVEGANNEWIAMCTYSPSFFIPISGTTVS